MNKYYRRSEAEKAFATQQGWKVARLHAGLGEIAAGSRSLRCEEYASQQLGDMFDHATVYEWLGGRRPAAIIVHPYGQFVLEQVHEVARRHGVQARIIEPGWYHPDAQTIIFWSRYPRAYGTARLVAKAIQTGYSRHSAPDNARQVGAKLMAAR